LVSTLLLWLLRFHQLWLSLRLVVEVAAV